MMQDSAAQGQLQVLVVDDDRRVRAALVGLLGAAGLTVIEATGDPRVAQTTVQRQRPDVAVVDLALPDPQTGLVLIGLLTSTYEVPVLALSAQEGLRMAARAAGASGFVDKGSPPEAVLAAIRATAADRRLDSDR